MNKKFLNPLSVLVTALVISVTAGCATVQTAFAPGVAEAKSGDSGSSFNGALVPGSIDLGMSPESKADSARMNAMAQYYAARQAAELERGRSAESARLSGMAELVSGSAGEALVPGSVDLQISKEVASSSWNGALIPGSLDLQMSAEAAPSFYSAPLVPGSVDLQIAR
jgi:hypothetical protein